MQMYSFLGIGNMGFEMVKHLIKQKKSIVNIYDINQKIYKKFTQKNVFKINILKDIPKQTNFFFTMVPDGKALEKIIIGKNGIIEKAKKGSVVIDCSSVDLSTTLKISKKLKNIEVDFLDAPVSGGVSGAKNASLTIMVGGEKKIFNKAKPVLSLLGKNVIYVGKTGSGQIIKTCNNMMLGINMIGICEAYILAKKLGIDKKTFFQICSNSSGGSWAMKNHFPIKGLSETSAANNNYKGGYSAKLLSKDLKISQALADMLNTKSLLGKKVKNLYEEFCRDYQQDLDYSAIIKYIDTKI